MDIFGFIAALFRPATELGRTYIEGKNRIKAAKIDASVAKWLSKAAAYENDAQRTHGWELEALRQAQYSWKDEMWSVILATILLYPLIMGALSIFTNDPTYTVALEASWKAYKDMPIFFQALFPFVILASMGIRWKGKREAADAIKKLGK